MKTFGTVMVWVLMASVPLTFVGAAIYFAIQETERSGYCKALDAELVNANPDICIKGDRIIHRF